MIKYQYWFSSLEKINKSKKAFAYANGVTADEIYHLTEKELRYLNIFTDKEIEYILYSRNSVNLEGLWQEFAEKGMGFSCLEQENYPSNLRNINNPPYSLFYIGKLPEEGTRNVAIVGARGRSAYGMAVAGNLAKQLAMNGVNIISGMALGIDGDSHKGALEGKGKTYAVLGCGADVCYPASHKSLYDKIVSNGGIISEYMPQTRPLKHNFPERNRIISGLSDLVIVVEAKEKSGSLITADFAMEQGKDVYAVPGRVTDSLSGGCNKLIYQGAGIVTDVNDILKNLDIVADTKNSYMEFRKKLLEKDELLVYSLTDFRPVSIGGLLEKLPFQLGELIVLLDKLEEKGFVKEIFPNHYVKTI